ncbi:spore coat U domain-containing protein [Sinorhizobium sp. 8-89]|uniref:Csu type fimbrial protein n=1 Tax=Sinorhizobium sp. 7-81 TaxID=3049087 RepID=UPI0024C40582|nr:spore coat U domain-containing protein [Sinorhizobium sp. 7-81]MDK1389734.1 spore coat U domain-containing protein [Sinorhizobium sp. 7-81]
MTDQYNRRYARDGGGSISIGGLKILERNGGWITNGSGQNLLTLTYLDRQQQDRVRPGPYTNTYQLVTKYLVNSGNATCDTGLPNPTGTIVTVTSGVPENCQFENFENIDFGSWGSVAAARASSTGVRAFGKVGIRCTYETDYTITIDDGQNASGGVRQMKSGTNFLAYQLFQPGCSIPWTTAPTSALGGIGTVVRYINEHQVCGQLTTPLPLAPAAGTYTDLVVVTATF